MKDQVKVLLAEVRLLKIINASLRLKSERAEATMRSMKAQEEIDLAQFKVLVRNVIAKCDDLECRMRDSDEKIKLLSEAVARASALVAHIQEFRIRGCDDHISDFEMARHRVDIRP